MSDAKRAHLVKMANQIALNMVAEGDAQADRTAAHIRRFWSPAMRQQLLEHTGTHAGEVPPVVLEVAEILAGSH